MVGLGISSAHTLEGAVFLGEVLPLWSALPFVGMLLSMALIEAIAPRFWQDHFGKISAGWVLICAVPFLAVYGRPALHEILHIYLADYLPFIILIGGLFTVGGGIVVRGSLAGTPIINTLMLVFGTVLASWMGTTGASMLLIRPLLRANAHRTSKGHLILFFIFLVSNIGGVLTPLGDPPLFLGFLHGVPFFWTFRLLPQMMVASGVLLFLFFVIDAFLYRKEKKRDDFNPHGLRVPLRIEGGINILFLLGIIGAMFISGLWHPGTSLSVLGIPIKIQNIARDMIIIVMGILSWKLTAKTLREANWFSWSPIFQVACLFAGIFMTMIPALLILKAGDQGALAFMIRHADRPARFFWMTGLLSGFLDNAPTYLTFFTSALGRFGLEEETVRQAFLLPPTEWSRLTQGGRSIDPNALVLFMESLEAISAGAVFMGALTYIGNAPNLIVKAIAEDHQVSMPSFFGYMACAALILIPLFASVQFLFF